MIFISWLINNCPIWASQVSNIITHSRWRLLGLNNTFLNFLNSWNYILIYKFWFVVIMQHEYGPTPYVVWWEIKVERMLMTDILCNAANLLSAVWRWAGRDWLIFCPQHCCKPINWPRHTVNHTSPPTVARVKSPWYCRQNPFSSSGVFCFSSRPNRPCNTENTKSS